MLGPHCCMKSFSSCNKQGLLSSCTTIASHCSGFSCWEAWALGSWASVIAVCGFSSSCDSSMASARILVHKFQSSGYVWDIAAAAAAKSLQSCLTLCDPRDGSPPGSSIPGILQARTLEWVAISEPHVNSTTNIVPFVRVHSREKYYFSLSLQ